MPRKVFTCEKGHRYSRSIDCPTCKKLQRTRLNTGDRTRNGVVSKESKHALMVKAMLKKVGPPLYGCV